MFAMGDRIELVRMGEDPDPIPPGEQGEVLMCTTYTHGDVTYTQVAVKWDCGRSLSVVLPVDRIRKVL